MRKLLASCATAAIVAVSASQALAEDKALFVVNSFYQNHPNPSANRALFDLAPRLRDAGFTVITVRNLDSATMAREMPDLVPRLTSEGRKLFVVAGHFVRDRRDSWLLLSDADRPGGFEIGRMGLSLGEIHDLAGANPGKSAVVVVDSEQTISNLSGFWRGSTAADVLNGVVSITGPARPVASFVNNELLQPGQNLRSARQNLPDGVRLVGYLPRTGSFVPEPEGPVISPETRFWNQTVEKNTAEAYDEYLFRYPNGGHAAEAQQRLDDLLLTPAQRAEAEEASLALTRDQRRAVQRALTLLGFDTRGVDGWFGRNTRQAIIGWQRSIGAPDHGFLNANQISRLETAAAIRAEELRREAEERRAEEERRDRNYWNRTGGLGTEQGLRAYLQRYPDGIFADQANNELRAIERARRRAAQAAERNAWDQAVTAGTLASYQAYLNAYPNGMFRQEAEARIQSLSQPETPPHVVQAAREEELSLNLNGFRRQLVEGQLKALNFDPGAVDGQFTRETRRALRRFQRANSMAVTGFVTRETVVRLLASAVQN